MIDVLFETMQWEFSLPHTRGTTLLDAGRQVYSKIYSESPELVSMINDFNFQEGVFSNAPYASALYLDDTVMDDGAREEDYNFSIDFADIVAFEVSVSGRNELTGFTGAIPKRQVALSASAMLDKDIMILLHPKLLQNIIQATGILINEAPDLKSKMESGTFEDFISWQTYLQGMMLQNHPGILSADRLTNWVNKKTLNLYQLNRIGRESKFENLFLEESRSSYYRYRFACAKGTTLGEINAILELCKDVSLIESSVDILSQRFKHDNRIDSVTDPASA